MVEHLAITGERVDAFLDARAAGILERHQGNTQLRRAFHHRHDFFGVHLADRTGRHREVLADCRHWTAIDKACPDHNAIGRQVFFLHAEIMAGMASESAGFLERVFLKQRVDTLTSTQQAFGVTRVYLVLTAADGNLVPERLHLFELGRVKHGSAYSS